MFSSSVSLKYDAEYKGIQRTTKLRLANHAYGTFQNHFAEVIVKWNLCNFLFSFSRTHYYKLGWGSGWSNRIVGKDMAQCRAICSILWKCCLCFLINAVHFCCIDILASSRDALRSLWPMYWIIYTIACSFIWYLSVYRRGRWQFGDRVSTQYVRILCDPLSVLKWLLRPFSKKYVTHSCKPRIFARIFPEIVRALKNLCTISLAPYLHILTVDALIY